MRTFDAEPSLIEDLKDEGQVVGTRETQHFTVTAVRHPTLGRLVVVEGPDGSGVVVESED